MIETKTIYTCPLCGKEFSKEKEYELHLVHEMQDTLTKLNNALDDLKSFNLSIEYKYHPMGQYHYFELQGLNREYYKLDELIASGYSIEDAIRELKKEKKNEI